MIPASVVALMEGGPPKGMVRIMGARTPLPGGPGGRMARECDPDIRRMHRELPMRMRRARAISTARLSGSPRLQLRPVDRVFYPGPYRKGNSSRRRLPA